jgi:hypothetical protein
MFIRFRQSTTGRLGVSIAQTRRINGAVKQTHVASLGSVSPARAVHWWVTVRERDAVWRELHDTIARESVSNDIAVKLMSSLHARVPLPTEVERGGAELAEAQHDGAFWEKMHGASMEQIEGYQGLIKCAEQKIIEERELAAREAENAEAAKTKAARLANYGGFDPSSSEKG